MAFIAYPKDKIHKLFSREHAPDVDFPEVTGRKDGLLIKSIDNLFLAFVEDGGGKVEEGSDLFGRKKLEVGRKRKFVGGCIGVGMNEQVEERNCTKTMIVEADQRANVVGVNPFPEHDGSGKIATRSIRDAIKDNREHRDVVGVDNSFEDVGNFLYLELHVFLPFNDILYRGDDFRTTKLLELPNLRVPSVRCPDIARLLCWDGSANRRSDGAATRSSVG